MADYKNQLFSVHLSPGLSDLFFKTGNINAKPSLECKVYQRHCRLAHCHCLHSIHSWGDPFSHWPLGPDSSPQGPLNPIIPSQPPTPMDTDLCLITAIFCSHRGTTSLSSSPFSHLLAPPAVTSLSYQPRLLIQQLKCFLSNTLESSVPLFFYQAFLVKAQTLVNLTVFSAYVLSRVLMKGLQSQLGSQSFLKPSCLPLLRSSHFLLSFSEILGSHQNPAYIFPGNLFPEEMEAFIQKLTPNSQTPASSGIFPPSGSICPPLAARLVLNPNLPTCSSKHHLAFPPDPSISHFLLLSPSSFKHIHISPFFKKFSLSACYPHHLPANNLSRLHLFSSALLNGFDQTIPMSQFVGAAKPNSHSSALSCGPTL